MQDIRVDDAFFGHPKTVRFYRRTGDHGIACLFRLWCYASRYFPKGILAGMNDQEISDASGWKNDPQEFVSALVDAGGPGKSGFLDLCETQCPRHYALHNWRTRNPYAYFRDERSDVARKAAETRWGKKRKAVKKQTPDAKGNAGSNAKRNAPAPSPAPAPNPSPSPKDKKSVDLSLSVSDDTGATAASGGVLEAPPAAAPVSLESLKADPDVVKLGDVISQRRKELGIPG